MLLKQLQKMYGEGIGNALAFPSSPHTQHTFPWRCSAAPAAGVPLNSLQVFLSLSFGLFLSNIGIPLFDDALVL